MSTIIIITPPTKDPRRQIVETPEGAEIHENGLSIATFTGEAAYDNAIKYLKVMKG